MKPAESGLHYFKKLLFRLNFYGDDVVDHLSYGILNGVRIKPAFVILFFGRTMFNKFIRNSQSLYFRLIVMIRHEFQYGTSKSAFDHPIFYGDDLFEFG